MRELCLLDQSGLLESGVGSILLYSLEASG